MNVNGASSARLHGYGIFALIAVVFQSLLVLFGWYSGHDALTSYGAHYIPMAPSTAIAFLLLSTGFLASTRSMASVNRWFPGFILIAAVCLLSVDAVFHFMFNTSFSLESSIFPDYGFFENVEKGRMSPLTGSMFLLCAASLMMSGFKKPKGVYIDFINTITLLASFSIIISYMIRTPLMYQMHIIPVALPTAIGFFLLGVYLIDKNKSSNVAKNVFLSQNTQSVLNRYFIPYIAVISTAQFVFTIRVINRFGERQIIIWGIGFSISLFFTAVITVVLGRRIGRRIDAVENALKDANSDLESEMEKREKAASALRASEERYSSYINNAPDGIFVTDSTGAYRVVNQEACKMTGYSESELLSMHISDLLHPDSIEHGLNSFQHLVESGKNSIEVKCVKKDGAAFHIHLNAIALPHDHYMAFCIDITDQVNAREYEKKFFEHDKMATVGKVAGKMAHDFNNLLGIIVGTSDILLSGDLPPEIAADIEIIKESAFKGRDLTRNLLLFAKDQETSLSRFDLNDMLDMVIKSLKSDLKGIDVVISHGTGVENILADSGLLTNALINLVQNSIHAMGKTANPQLRLGTSCDENNAVFEIEDNGCGIPPEYKGKIYDPTFTLKGGADRSSDYKRDIKGSGYGMANVKRFVDKHGGTISFLSNHGGGTKFTVKLPLIKEGFDRKEIDTIRSHGVVENKRILIAEDEHHLGRTLYSSLAKFNHRIDLAMDGRMALDHIRNNEYDLISLDFMMPDINGIDIYRTIRKTNKEIPIIFVSGNFEFMQSMIDLKKEDPKVDHLAKPFNNVEYVNKIHQWLI